jgi:hypothetical protein
LLCCVGTSRSAPFRSNHSYNSGWPLTHAPLAVRLASPASGDSRSRTARHRLAVMSVTIDPSDSRHQSRGGSAWELPTPASVRRSVMRALLPRESTLQSIPSTEPVFCLGIRAPVGSTPYDVCHADPPRVVTAGRAFTTKSTDL